MSRIIDAHHHFWHYTVAEFDWIDDSMAAIRRDYLARDLEAELKAAGVDAAISVQARQTIEETQWLLQIAAASPFIAGVVGWAPLADHAVDGTLEQFAANPKLRGVRHVLQGEADEYMLMPQFNRGISLLRAHGLVYDVLILERQLPAAIKMVDAHPDQVFVLDHVAKPLIASGVLEPWRTRIAELARRPNVYCKISGMVTEDNWIAKNGAVTWSAASLAPYVDTVLEAFGPRRLMYGSDWPVCLVASSYSRWLDTVKTAIAGLSADEQSWILGRTAEQAYGLASKD